MLLTRNVRHVISRALALTLFNIIIFLSPVSAQVLPRNQQIQSKNPPEVVLPRYQTREELEAARTDGAGSYLWECFPSLVGFTPGPPSTARFPTESEQTSGVLYGWPSYGCQMPELTEMIRNSIRRVGTTVFVPPQLLASAQSCLRSRGFTDDDLAQINWFTDTGLDGVWMRDYGPEIMVDTVTGNPYLIDLGYYSGPGGGPTACGGPWGGRPQDDVSPTWLALTYGLEVFRPQLRTEGGAIQTDGRGTCVRTTRDVLTQNNFSRWQYTQGQIDDIFREYFKCPNVIMLESLERDPFGFRVIDHEDMFMTFISPTKILMGQYDPADDPINSAILDRNAQRLRDAGYNVVRLPMPKPYCTLGTPSCIANPGSSRLCGSLGLDRVWATYANSMRVGNRVLVPIYRDVPPSLRDTILAQEAEALATFQRELDAEFGPGTVEVVPIMSDAMIPCQGSLHCIAMTY